MPSDKLSRAITERVLARDDRQAFEMATNVFRELFDGGVAPLWFFSQRHQNDIVEIAAEHAAQLLGLRVARFTYQFRRNRDRGYSVGGCCFFDTTDRGAGFLRILFADDALDLLRQRRIEPIWMMASQQFVEQHAECIHVARCSDALAANL